MDEFVGAGCPGMDPGDAIAGLAGGIPLPADAAVKATGRAEGVPEGQLPVRREVVSTAATVAATIGAGVSLSKPIW